ncbi:acetyl-CoA carboxylase biotin carboxylase subunit family protein [Sporosarcina sp.]|uniref:ATP-grasp domain-containing protein n=1 Tax=Sporosarcina sp. TaxID=49982 RepID=UPI0026086C4C|nr:ATP-grasp domain-containing protein [Sporosarcina sp.]
MNIYVLNILKRAQSNYKEWLGTDANLYILSRNKHKEQYSDFENNICFENFNYSPFRYLQKNINSNEENYLVGTSEYDLVDLGRLRGFFGIKGQKEESALAFRDKVIMKEKVSKVIKTPNFKRLLNKFEVLDFINDNGFPIVIKPVDGAGSVNTFVIYNSEELDVVLDEIWCNNLMVESYVSGDMYHIDGIFFNGKILLSRPSKYINGCLAYQEKKYLGSVLLDKDNPLYHKLNESVEKILQSIPTDLDFPTVFHCELFYTLEDEIVFCEIASRVGGGKIVEVMEEVTGINLLEEWIKGQAGKPINYEDKDYGSGGWILIPPPRAGIVKKILNIELPEWVIHHEIKVKESEVLGPAKTSIEHAAAFVVKGENQDDIESKINKLNDLFLESLIYEENE